MAKAASLKEMCQYVIAASQSVPNEAYKNPDVRKFLDAVTTNTILLAATFPAHESNYALFVFSKKMSASRLPTDDDSLQKKLCSCYMASVALTDTEKQFREEPEAKGMVSLTNLSANMKELERHHVDLENLL